MRWLILIIAVGCSSPTITETTASLEEAEVADAAEEAAAPEPEAVETEEYVASPHAPTVPVLLIMNSMRRMTSVQRRRAERWNIPDTDTMAATVLTLARIIVSESGWSSPQDAKSIFYVLRATRRNDEKIGRASGRERVEISVGAASFKKKTPPPPLPILRPYYFIYL